MKKHKRKKPKLKKTRKSRQPRKVRKRNHSIARNPSISESVLRRSSVIKIENILNDHSSFEGETFWGHLQNYSLSEQMQRCPSQLCYYFDNPHEFITIRTGLYFSQDAITYDINVLEVTDGFVIIHQLGIDERSKFCIVWLTKTNKVKNHITKYREEIFSERDVQYWQWATISQASDKSEPRLILSSYDAQRNVIVDYDVFLGRESVRYSFNINRHIKKLNYQYFWKNRIENMLNVDLIEYVGEEGGIAVCFDLAEKTLISVDVENETVIWTAKAGEKIYSNIYRGMVVSAKEEYVWARELDTGKIVFDSELENDNSWCYTSPVVLAGDLYITTQDGFLWRLNIQSNRSLPNTESVYNLNTGFKCIPIHVYSLPYFRCNPIVRHDSIILYGVKKPAANLSSKHFTKTNDHTLYEQRELVISIFKPHYASYALQWLLGRVNYKTGQKIANMIGQDPISEITQDDEDRYMSLAIGKFKFEKDLSGALFRNKDFYGYAKLKSFVKAYYLEQMNYPGLESLDPKIRDLSVEDFYSTIYGCMKSTFVYNNDFPSFDDLFFSDRQTIFEKLDIDYSKSKVMVSEIQITDRARYLLKQISYQGGLTNFHYEKHPGDHTIFKKLKELSSIDRAFVYEYNYFHYSQMNYILANNLGYALFQAGFPSRSIFYLFLTHLIPYEDSKTKKEDRIFGPELLCLIRAVSQLYLEKSKGEMLALIDESSNVPVDGLKQDYHFFFGYNFSGEERINTQIAKLKNYIEKGDVYEAKTLFREVNWNIGDYLLRVENEKLQIDVIGRFIKPMNALIDMLIMEKDYETSFQFFENLKSKIIRLYLSKENRRVLSKRLKKEKYYRDLQRAFKHTITKGENERGIAVKDETSEPNITDLGKLFLNSEGVYDSSLKSIVSVIPTHAVLLEYYISKRNQGVFVLSQNGIRKFVELSSISDSRNLVKSLTRCISSASTAIGLEEKTNYLLSRLYEILVKPLNNYLKDFETLILVPTGHLFSVPFTALFDGKQYLIQSKKVSITPSASIFNLSSALEPQGKDNITFVRPSDDKMHGIEIEENVLKKIFRNKLSIMSTAVGLSRAEINNYLHVSAHGVFNSEEPLLSSILLDDNHAITVLDLYNLDLKNTRLAVVNTCLSGCSHVEGSDELLGLVRGLIIAGCPSIINTLWMLSDQISPVFTQKLYSIVSDSKTNIEAFATVINEILENKEYGNPYYWGGYQYYGKL